MLLGIVFYSFSFLTYTNASPPNTRGHPGQNRELTLARNRENYRDSQGKGFPNRSLEDRNGPKKSAEAALLKTQVAHQKCLNLVVSAIVAVAFCSLMVMLLRFFSFVECSLMT